MAPVLTLACPQCGRLHEPRALVCALCGNLLRHEKKGEVSVSSVALQACSAPPHASEQSAPLETFPSPRPAALPRPSEVDIRFAALRQLIPAGPEHAGERVARQSTVRAPFRSAPPPHPEERDATRTRIEPWLYLALGLATSPVFALTPILGYMGWFLASLVHEMGHAAFAWSCGMPAVPAISLDGHAAAVHSEQSLLLVLLIGSGLAAGAWRLFEGRVRWIVLAFIAAVYPAIAFTTAKELLHLLAGHGAELAFATLCLWKTLDGGFTESRLERASYGTVGWYLLGKNMHLCWGLMRSTEARAEYDDNGSFGLTNDYIRVAGDVLSCPLERVALAMLIASLFVLPAAVLLWRVSCAMRGH